MVTKYDVFEIVIKRRVPTKPKQVLSALRKDAVEYKTIWMMMQALVDEKILVKTEHGFQGHPSTRTTLLYNLIKYCVHNGVNYNDILDKNIASFIARALDVGVVTSKNAGCDSKTFQRYLKILEKYGLVLTISRKPIKTQIFYNSLVKNLLTFFKIKPKVKRFSQEFLLEIKKELDKFTLLRRKNEEKYQQIVTAYEMRFVHHSLSLEGNPITLPDTLLILQKNVIPKSLDAEAVDEVRNYQQAITTMLQDSAEKGMLTIPTILNYHALALSHRKRIAGQIRDVGVHIRGNKNFKIGKLGDIRPRLEKLLQEYTTFRKKKKKSLQEILTFAGYFHNEFQQIHPFEDGNSRTTRLLTFYILLCEDIPILDIPFGLLDEYMLNTKRSQKRVDANLVEFLQKVILYNLKIINEKL